MEVVVQARVDFLRVSVEIIYSESDVLILCVNNIPETSDRKMLFLIPIAKHLNSMSLRDVDEHEYPQLHFL